MKVSILNDYHDTIRTLAVLASPRNIRS